MAQHDLIIRNGLIVDGQGGEPFIGDVAVSGDHISAVGKVDGTGKREVDAKGKIVTPGFVDIHTHYDGQAIWSSQLNPSSSHGVTTVVVGNCGVGFAPCRPDDHDLLIKFMEGVEDIPGAVMAEGLTWTWETFPQFMDALEARPHDIDVAAYLPHSPLRVYVMGERGAKREAATPEDLKKMRALTAEAIKAGAIGFATSRLVVHKSSDGRPIPTFEVAYSELEAVAEGMNDAGSGILQMVPNGAINGWNAELTPLIDVGRKTGRPITFTMSVMNSLEGPMARMGWQEGLKTIDDANNSGVDIKGQVFPRPIGLVSGLRVSANPFCLCPSYIAIENLPLPQRVAEMKKPEVRARILGEKPTEGHPLAMIGRNFRWTFIVQDSPDYEPDLSTSIEALAKAKGVTPEEFAYDALLENEGKALLWVAMANFPGGSLEELHTLLTSENMVVGLGDGGAHYGMVSDFSYSTFILSYWARDRKGLRMTLPQAVKMLANEPAQVVGLKDRGILAPGYKADINVIDHAKLALEKPDVIQDLPAGGKRLHQGASGYVATVVNGQIIAENDKPTGVLPGRLVRGMKQAPGQVKRAS